jgi:major membrane immunogen (membrane-anchored lipoprotein)
MTMRKIRGRFQMVAIMIVLSSFVFADNPPDKDDLETIKKYKPDDKYFKATMVTLHFLIETSSIERTDSIFQQIIDAYKLPVKAEGVKDGMYYGASPYDAYDYKHVVKLEVKNEEIISVDYNEVHKSGVGKQEDEAYCEEMSITGTTPAIAYPDMEQQLISKQNILDVDGVSGASYSLFRFRYAVTIALMKAMINDN